MKSTTVHLRVPLTLKASIDRLAKAERRTWTQMAVLLLQDAARTATSGEWQYSPSTEQRIYEADLRNQMLTKSTRRRQPEA